MSEMTPDAVRHLAGLARIALSDEEITRLAGELGAIVQAVESVQSVATADIPPTSTATRSAERGLEKAKCNAPQGQGGS